MFCTWQYNSAPGEPRSLFHERPLSLNLRAPGRASSDSMGPPHDSKTRASENELTNVLCREMELC